MQNEILVFRQPEQYGTETIKRKLHDLFAEKPVVKVFLFGSHARREADAWSDLDLLVIASTHRPFVERFKDFKDIFTVFPETELLVYTPEEFDMMCEKRNPFIKKIIEEGVQIFHAKKGRS
jgi:predicted nucleotidyltransferase